MGKLRRRRQKLHISSKTKSTLPNNLVTEPATNIFPSLPLNIVSRETVNDNVFAGLTINFDNVKKNLGDDMKSVKSVKSERGLNKIAKKDKVKLRRQLLLKRIDSVNQMKKEEKLREKRRNVPIIGDTNPLHDSLPSLESLLKSKPNISFKVPMGTSKRKGIEKANKRRKRHIQDVNTFKSTLKAKKIYENIFDIISNHVNNVVKRDKNLTKK